METNTSLVQIVQESGLEKTKADYILEHFQDHFKIASEWETKAKALQVTDVSQVAEMKMAREGRLFLKAKRVEIEKTRKELKDSSLREGQTIDSIAKILKNLIEPTENYLEEQEKFAERKEAARVQELREGRAKDIEPYIEHLPFQQDFGFLSGEEWHKLFNYCKSQHEAKIEADRKAEAERIERERLDRLEQERRFEIAPFVQFVTGNPDLRSMSDEDYSSFKQSLESARSEYNAEQAKIRQENERLKKEAEEKEAKRQEELRKQHEAEQARLKAEQEERERIESEHQAKLKAERAEREKLESELKAKMEAEEKARKEAEEKAKEEKLAAEKAAKAPKKEKLKAWVLGINTSIPTGLENDEAAREIFDKFQGFKNWATEQIEEI